MAPKHADPAAHGAVGSLNTRVAVTETRPASDVVAAALRQPAFRMWLLGWFALASLVLAVIGIYGIVSQGIAQRTREIRVTTLWSVRLDDRGPVESRVRMP